jgi:hypothetical protein
MTEEQEVKDHCVSHPLPRKLQREQQLPKLCIIECSVTDCHMYLGAAASLP